MRHRQLVLYWGPVMVYAAGIFYLSSLTHIWVPLEGEVERFDPGRLLFHIAEYSVLGYLLLRALANADGLAGMRSSHGRILLLAVLLGALYGITDELHQYFVPNRNASFMDWAGDTVGSLVGSIIGKARYCKKG